MATISEFDRSIRPLVRKTIETIRSQSWKVYEDPSPKGYLALKMHGNLICGFYPRARGFSLGYWDAPAGRHDKDKWVKRTIRREEDLGIHLAMVQARVVHVLMGTR